MFSNCSLLSIEEEDAEKLSKPIIWVCGLDLNDVQVSKSLFIVIQASILPKCHPWRVHIAINLFNGHTLGLINISSLLKKEQIFSTFTLTNIGFKQVQYPINHEIEHLLGLTGDRAKSR